MPMTKSEVMYLSIGLAVGGMVGANWSKVKPLLESMMGPAADGLGDAYGDLVGSLASQVEAFQDAAAERSREQKEVPEVNRRESSAPFARANGHAATSSAN
jgi:hypothetical protein